MASIHEEPAGLSVMLSRWEVVGGLHRGFVIPAECIMSDSHVEDGWNELRGWRCPGTGIPWVIMLGTMRHHGTKDYCAVYGRRPARVITCRDFEFERVIVSDPK